MERRTVARIPFTGRGKAATLPSAESGIIYTTNINRHGLCFYSTASLALGSEVILELEFGPPQEHPAIEHLHGRVLWKREWDSITAHGVHLSSPLDALLNPRYSNLIAASEGFYKAGRSINAEPAPFKELLTKREVDVIRLIAQGASNRQMSQRLSISIKTVETHRANIYAKLKVHNAVQLLRTLEKSAAWIVNEDPMAGPARSSQSMSRVLDSLE
jgi:DNA-binding CsgD family transcriptional regulator